MKTIHKYQLELGSSTIKMPREFRILHVGNQRGSICVWAEIDTISPYTGKEPIQEEVRFWTVGTGHQVPDDLEYLGTVIIEPFVWHVYLQGIYQIT